MCVGELTSEMLENSILDVQVQCMIGNSMITMVGNATVKIQCTDDLELFCRRFAGKLK